jgi:branched-chain amino acid transport system permease protein
MIWMNAVLQGVFLGGLYALFASGLSLMFGVMRFVNFAHGDFIIVAAYSLLTFAVLWGWHPVLAVVIVLVLLGAAGYVNQRLLLNRVLGKGILPPVLVTFSMSIIIQNALMEAFSADSRKIQTGSFETISLTISDDISIGLLPFLIFLTAIVVIGLMQLIFYRTGLGRLLRATSDDAEIVPLMGGNNAHIFALATMLASLVVAVAGMFLALKTNFDPSAGPARLLFAFEAIIIGGLGNLWGTLLGGIILGVSQTIGAQIDAGYQILAGHLAFLAILIFRPSGLFPKVKD